MSRLSTMLACVLAMTAVAPAWSQTPEGAPPAAAPEAKASPFTLDKPSCRALLDLLIRDAKQQMHEDMLAGLASTGAPDPNFEFKMKMNKSSVAGWENLLKALGGPPPADEARDAGIAARSRRAVMSQANQCQMLRGQ